MRVWQAKGRSHRGVRGRLRSRDRSEQCGRDDQCNWCMRCERCGKAIDAVSAWPHTCSSGTASLLQCRHGLTRAMSARPHAGEFGTPRACRRRALRWQLRQRSRRLVVSGMFSDCTLDVVTCGAAARHELKRRKRGVRSDARECAADAIDTFIQSKRSVRSSRRCDRCDRRVRRDLCERVERCLRSDRCDDRSMRTSGRARRRDRYGDANDAIDAMVAIVAIGHPYHEANVGFK